MQFIKPQIEDYGKYKRFLQIDELSCENLYLNALIWQDIYHHEFAFFDDETLVIRLYENGGYIYLLPLGKSFYPALNAIIDMLGENDHLTASQGKRLELLSNYIDDFDLIPAEENFDYIYKVSDLEFLAGKKYHQKRNHISAFTRKYNWTYSSICDDNLEDFITVAKLWAEERKSDADNSDIECELAAIVKLLPHYRELDISGGVLYVDDAPVAFALGCPINNKVFDVTTEKALSGFPGAYTVINNEFVKRELSGKYDFVNREDDLGLEGLRRAKRSYYPVEILEKYLIDLKKKP